MPSSLCGVDNNDDDDDDNYDDDDDGDDDDDDDDDDDNDLIIWLLTIYHKVNMNPHFFQRKQRTFHASEHL